MDCKDQNKDNKNFKKAHDSHYHFQVTKQQNIQLVSFWKVQSGSFIDCYMFQTKYHNLKRKLNQVRTPN